MLLTYVSSTPSSVSRPWAGRLCIHFISLPPSRYNKGDVVIFFPIKLQRSKSTAPILMHVDRPKPYMIMDIASYGAFGIRPGRMYVSGL